MCGVKEVRSPPSVRLLLGCSAMLFLGACCLPSEKALSRKFHSHRSSVEKILAMASEDDHVTRIAPEFTWLEDDVSWPRSGSKLGFSEEKWEEYRRLFKEAAVPDGIVRRDSAVYFLVETCGIVGSGRTNGYVYSETLPSPILESLRELREEGTGYVPLEGNWYLFAERD